MAAPIPTDTPELATHADGAAARLCQGFFTGLVLTLVAHRGKQTASEWMYGFFRRKQREQFLQGLDKLGLEGLPDAVACARYHYLSNQLGGVGVQIVEESERKAWIRYPPPRWAWTGTAICGVPTEVSRAMLRGWHARNGISLENPRLGFVCTGQTVDGAPGLEGYYVVESHELEPEDRLRFAPGESMPRFDPAAAPEVPSASWPEERLRKAHRNYGMDYVKTAMQVLIEQRGEMEATELGGRTARLIGMQLVDEARRGAGVVDRGASGVVQLIVKLSQALGDATRVTEDGEVTQVSTEGWRLLRGAEDARRGGGRIWSELWRGLALGTDHEVHIEVNAPGSADTGWRWRVSGPAR